jgi:D-aspartate ligase
LIADGDVGAVVLGGDYQGLGIVRSIGRKGYPVSVIDDEFSISRFSRFTTFHDRVASLRDEQHVVDALLEVATRRSLDGWVLFPTREEIVAALSRNLSVLQTRFRIPTPPWDVIRWAYDKRNTYELAERLGIPTPRTWYFERAEDAASISAEPPYAVKPAIKERFLHATKAKAWRADSRAELRDLFEAAAAIVGPREVLVQEIVPGDGRHQFAFCAFFKDGDSLGSLVARRTRQHPPEFGRASTFAETVDLPVLEERSKRLLRAIDYYGLVEVEYKRDPRDGEYKLLDVNPRTWGYHTIGEPAGVDFPYLLFADQLGLGVGPKRGAAGVKWLRLTTDLATAIHLLIRRNLNLRTYLRSLVAADTEAVFSRDDPLPALAEVLLIPYLMVKRGF